MKINSDSIDKGKNIICGCVYRHPNHNTEDFIKYISKCTTVINNEKKECFIAGDYNIDLMKYSNNSNCSEFINSMSSSGFLPFILQPTRIAEFNATVIDNIYSNVVNKDSLSGNILIKFADHLTQFISIDMEISKAKHTPIYRRDFTHFDEQLFKDDLSIQNWNPNNANDTNTKFNDFLWRTEGCVERHAPLKKLSKKQEQKITVDDH